MKKTILFTALGALILGAILGFWGAGMLTKKRMQSMKHRTGADILNKKIFRHLEPIETQELQWENIKNENGSILDSLNKKHRNDVKKVIKRTLVQLEPVTTPEQLKTLERLKRRAKKRGEKKKKNRHKE